MVLTNHGIVEYINYNHLYWNAARQQDNPRFSYCLVLNNKKK